MSNVAIASMYFGSYHSSLFLVGSPGYSSSASETDSASLADVPVSSTSFDRDRRPGHLHTRTGCSLYPQMRLSLMLAVKPKRSSWYWTGTLFCCVLWRYNSHPLTTATLSTQNKIQQYQSLWSDISISNRSTRPLCLLYSYTVAGHDTPTYFSEACPISLLLTLDK